MGASSGSRLRLGAISLVVASVLGGCGGDDAGRVATTSPGPPETASTAAPAPAPATSGESAPVPETAAAEPPATTAAPEQQPGGAGDEEGNAVPVRLALGAGELGDVAAPAFLSLALQASAQDGRTHRLQVGTRPPVERLVAPGAPLRVTVPGQQRGRYEIRVDGARRGTLVVG